MANPILTADRLREVLDYDRDTGLFTWKFRDDRSRSWNSRYAGTRAGTLSKASGYRHISIDKALHYEHRLAWLYTANEWPANKIDHLNGIRTDNRIENLRDASDAINAQNQRKAPASNKSTGVMGVHLFKRTGRFQASITINKKPFHLGYFDTVEAAHEAYLSAKRKNHEGCTI